MAPSKRDEFLQLPVIAGYLKTWKAQGLLPKGFSPSLPSLIELGIQRFHFVAAIERCTPAWGELVVACRSMREAQLDRVHDDGTLLELPMLTASQVATVDWWLRMKHVDVPWMREWVTRAVHYLGYRLDARSTPDFVDMLYDEDEGGPPIPNPHEMAHRSRRFEWDEPGPMPRFERFEDFQERMTRRWKEAAAIFEDSQDLPRKTELHADRFARFQVGGETVQQICASSDSDIDERRVRSALKDFSDRIGLPRRTEGLPS
jgi:hypothetical protein